MQELFERLGQKLKSTTYVWMKSHFFLSLIVFALLLVGLSVINYKIVDFGNIFGIIFIALLLAVLDFLPIVGLLFPMSVWSVCAIFFYKNERLGFSVIILCLIIMLIKQLAEPFLVGKTMGISPLEEVGSCVVGYLLLGTNPLGFVIGPIFYTVGKSVYLKLTNQPFIRETRRAFFDRKKGEEQDFIDISDEVEDVDEDE